MDLINSIHHIVIECDRPTNDLEVDLGGVLIYNKVSEHSVKYDVNNSYREDNLIYCLITDEDCRELFAYDSIFDLTEEDINSDLHSELFIGSEDEFEILNMELILHIDSEELSIPCTAE